jgi:hypothetical protein
MEAQTFIKKAATNLLLQSSKYNPADDQKNAYRKSTNNVS